MIGYFCRKKAVACIGIFHVEKCGFYTESDVFDDALRSMSRP